MLRVGRNREKNTRMPIGWDPKPSGIYFKATNKIDAETTRSITGGKTGFRLGSDESEAAANPLWQRIVAARKVTEFKPGFVSEIIDRARRSYLPRIKNLETRAWRSRHVDEIERLWSSMRFARTAQEAMRMEPGTVLMDLQVQAHIDACSESRPVAVNRMVQTGEQVWDDARRRWGLTAYNPFSGLQMNPEAPRDVLPENKALRLVYRKLDPPMRFCMQMARYYGRRRGELLKLSLSSAQADGLHFMRGKPRPGKRPKEIIIRWDAKLQRLWARLMVWREGVKRGGVLQTTMAILNRDGKPYTPTGYNSARIRAMERCGIKGEFTFHDLRAKGATDAGSAEEAQSLLAHDDIGTTTTVYRRGPHVIDLRADSRKVSENSRKGKR